MFSEPKQQKPSQDEPRVSHQGTDVLLEYLKLPADKRRSFSQYVKNR
jgi:hypothetical protein